MSSRQQLSPPRIRSLSCRRQKAVRFSVWPLECNSDRGHRVPGATAAFEATLDERYPVEQTLRSPARLPLVLISADGQPFAKRGECIAEPITLNELPRHFIDAVLAREDRRFYSHIGIDPRGILRAASRNYRAGVIREGGSTITQQLVKISFLTSSTTFARKLEEALVAMWLEKRLTKNQILERYLSSAYFGKGCFGVRAAARYFFDKPVRGVECIGIGVDGGSLRSPIRFSKNLDEARKDARLVVQAMVRDGRLDEKSLAHLQPAGSLLPGRTSLTPTMPMGSRARCKWR